MSKTEKWNVTISEDRSIDDIQSDLSDKGFAVEQVFESIGSIRGKLKDDVDIESIKSISGVIDIKPAPPEINIGNPDSNITW